MNNRQRLIDLMGEHKLERRRVADMLNIKREVVDHWLISGESKLHTEIPEMAIELLEYKLGVRHSGKQDQQA